ncbi:MAG: hypoxanthine phosphoribosyltransferase, partial [Actinobacteria bacterium]|nr:hypoxanthine phosphoribosyltransferase [Actinomycetota bacterium]
SIATGHIADDVAETVVLNLARGAGLRGISGIPPKRGRVVRPLIERYREEVLRYLDHLGQPYRTDRSNLQPKYARNRVRLEVLPVLEELYPGARSNIVRGATLLRDDLEMLEELAAEVVRRCEDEVLVPIPELRMLPAALRRYAIRVAYSMLLPDAPPLGSGEIETILGLAQKDDGTRMFNPSQDVVVAVRGGTNISFYRRTEPFSGECEVRTDGFEFAGWIVDVRKARKLDEKDAARPEVAYLDASKGPFRVRMAREGDTIRPLGLGGEKKVFRAMMDRKVPKDLRRRTPAVVDGAGRVAWVFLGELGEEFKVTPATEKVLRMEVKMSSMMADVREVLISSEEIQEKVRALGERITQDYAGERILLVGVLRGAVVIMGDLMRCIDLPCEIDFMDISSYGSGTSSSGVVRILKDLHEDITGRHVLIVEDIIDTGLTLSYLRRSLLARGPASLEICAFLTKPSRRRVQFDVKYLGFEVPDEFVVGYGLDYAGAYRNLPDVCVLKEEVFKADS